MRHLQIGRPYTIVWKVLLPHPQDWELGFGDYIPVRHHLDGKWELREMGSRDVIYLFEDEIKHITPIRKNTTKRGKRRH